MIDQNSDSASAPDVGSSAIPQMLRLDFTLADDQEFHPTNSSSGALNAGFPPVRYGDNALVCHDGRGPGEKTVTGGSGSDHLLGGTGKDLLIGGAGNDLLFTGGGRGDILRGGKGDDFLSSSSVMSYGAAFFGGPGNDTIELRYVTTVRVDGGDGFDTLNLGHSLKGSTYRNIEKTVLTHTTVTIDADQVANLGKIVIDGKYQTHTGTMLLANTANQYVSFDGLLLRDNDSFGIGMDERTHAAGLVVDLSGVRRTADSKLGVTVRSDTSVIGSDFADTLYGIGTGLMLRGGGGDDIISFGYQAGGTGFGGDGNDFMWLNRAENVFLSGREGDDLTQVLRATDAVLKGGIGSDTFQLKGYLQDSRIIGGAGEDIVLFDHGAAALGTTFAGIERSYLTSTNGPSVDAGQIGHLGRMKFSKDAARLDFAGLSLTNVDGAVAGFRIDLDSDDLLRILVRGAADENVKIHFANSRLATGASITVNASAANETILGTHNDDWFIGYGGQDDLRGADGDDILSGGAGRDFLRAGAGADRLSGGTGSDHLSGGRGDDILNGDHGRDRLSGGQGQDRLAGGKGSDVLKGGSGRDTFVFAGSANDGADTITDWQDGKDLIEIGGGVDFDDLVISQAGQDVLMTWKNSELLIQNSAAPAFDTADFLFA